MGPRYERLAHQDEDLDVHGNITSSRANASSTRAVTSIPNSAPPSFRSLPEISEPNTELSDSFDSPSDDEDDMRNVRGSQNANFRESIPLVSTNSSTTQASSAAGGIPGGRIFGGGQTDGVFANISAKPTVGEKVEEHPPSYEQAAADATPPYWETTILAPGMASDEVFIDGLPVGSVFAFIWNAMISMSFQFVGFLLTYLLHTTHAAKNGSRAGLGITLIQYGFYMRSRSDDFGGTSPPAESEPQSPNSYDLSAQDMVDTGSSDRIGKNEYLSYILMIVGWFILIRSVRNFLQARQMEQVVLSSPDRGLGTAIIAENEDSARAV
ncbi:uncharacterized protein H6S33_012853 [Morchella sextelata]|uniref:uncharacterized protein n=1 Tax=Morchella sextelata TaxID=1174677 RepID=UPI001D05870A|nr:uncharacterized protein H6S33_012853 [Morchella sextelata]KAH0609367.1 hypothetical protein H6S33_012853 [Morchella sextelata]